MTQRQGNVPLAFLLRELHALVSCLIGDNHMRFSFLLAMLFSLSAFADPPEIVTAPKGVKAIYKDQLTGYHGKDGEFARWYTEISSFDEAGRLVSMVTKYPDNEWSLPVEETFSYKLDDKGRVLEKTHTYQGIRKEVWKYEYSNDGSYVVADWLCAPDGALISEDDLYPEPKETWHFSD